MLHELSTIRCVTRTNSYERVKENSYERVRENTGYLFSIDLPLSTSGGELHPCPWRSHCRERHCLGTRLSQQQSKDEVR